ncbi:MAG: nuclear transport factor 2 family protein [Alteraurantiacibacter sp.]
MTNTATLDRATIERLESRFWQSMIDKDPVAAKALIADESLIAGPTGVMSISPRKFEEMTKDGKWTLDSFEFSDVLVSFPNDTTAVVAYKVHQTGSMDGKPMDLNCADTSTWVKDGEDWKCALHTETVLGQMPLTN